MSAEPRGRAEPEVEFQYRDAAYQSDTAITGMWLFLASEMLFFGGLFLSWCFYRHQYPRGFAEATEETQFAIGTANTVVLVTSSFVYACVVAWARLGKRRRVLQGCAVTILLGAAFLALKMLEWYLDISGGDVPLPGFKPMTSEATGASLFWVFYYAGTVLHGVHLLIGMALVAWIIRKVRRGRVLARSVTAIEVVGLYWSFVDMVWMILYPLIYLAGRAG